MADGQAQFVASANRVGLTTFLALCRAAPRRNIVLSPPPLATGLLLVHAAATGDTRSEVEAALGLDNDTALGWRPPVSETVNRPEGAGLITAVSLWLDRTCSLKRGFLEDARRLGAHFAQVQFGDESACAAINEWGRARTAGQIARVVDTVDCAGGTVLLILTVFHLKARWAQPFDPLSTRDRPFKLSDGTEKPCPTMHGAGTFRYGQLGQFEAVDLSLADGAMALRVLLPAGAADDAVLAALVSRLPLPERVGEVAIPRFRIDLSIDLVPALTVAGLGTVFSPNAQFGRLSMDHVLVGRIRQRVTATVDESGAEAAAATSIQFIRSFVSPHFSFVADRPFYWAIYDTESDLLLLTGRVADPEET